MGYDLHITKKEEWHNEGLDISREEWLSYLASDSEFGKPQEYGQHLYAEWTNPTNNKMAVFGFRAGHLTVKDPEKETVEKMKKISRSLNAKVQGDDGEQY